jgi:hypothetical protein
MSPKQFISKQFSFPNNIPTYLFLLINTANTFIYVQSLSTTKGIKIITNSNLNYNQNIFWIYAVIIYFVNTFIAFILQTKNAKFNNFFVIINTFILLYAVYLSWLSFLNL